MIAELMGSEYQGPAPLDNRFFMPLGAWESARHRFEGTLSVPEFMMHNSEEAADSARPWEYFPGFSMDFFTHGKVLVPVSREVIQPPGDRNYWRIVVSPGTVWSEPGDSGLSRASFPFALVNNSFNDVHNGLATFVYDETRVSSLFLQVTQETSPVFKADFWGATPVVYLPHRLEKRKSLAARFVEEEKHQIPILPFSALAAKVNAVLLDTFSAGIERKEISATGLIWNGTLYLHPCCTRTGDYPYGRYMRHAAYSLTKAMGALIAMLRLAGKYGEGVFDLKVADYVEIKAAHDGWKSVTFADALNMATGVGDHMPERVEPNAMHGDEDQPKFMGFLRARSRQEKMDIAFSYGDYPWGPGEVARYSSINTFLLSAAMDGFLKSKEGPEADIWDMVLTEVFGPIGIFYAPIMRTIEPDGSSGLPPFGYGLYPNVDDVAKLSILLQNGGRHQERQLLHSGRLAEALYKTQVIGLPTGEKDEYGDVTYHLAFNGLPWRCQDGRIQRIPVSTGFGGNHWVLLPNGITTFRFCDANQYGVGSMIKVAEGIGVAQTAQKDDSPVLKGPYLGQKPPGNTPEIFAPGIVSTGMSESAIAVAPDGKEIFYTVHAGNSETIITTRFKNNYWTAPEVAPFSGKYLDGFPAMHPDGSKLFFHSYRPLDKGSQIAEVVNIWFVEKKGAGWSEPRPVGPPVNGNGFVCCPSVTKTGTLYFSKKTRDGGERIYRSRFVNGKYMEPEELPRQVNREKEQYHAVISPDENYLILPRDNYLVSFRDEHDQWSDSIPLGNAVNEMKSGGCPSISSDGKYVFIAAYPKVKWNRYFEERHTFKDLQEITLQRPAADRTDIFWVDAKVIREFRSEK